MPNPALLGNLYHILDTRQCWVGPMDRDDAMQLITQELSLENAQISDEEMRQLMDYSGNLAALLQATCRWWARHRQTETHHKFDMLYHDASIQFRLKELWHGLTQEEQQFLIEWQFIKKQLQEASSQRSRNVQIKKLEKLEEKHTALVERVKVKGLVCQDKTGWQLFSALFATYVLDQQNNSRGKLWFNEDVNLVFQGQTALDDLTPLEGSILQYLVNHPNKRHTYSDIIQAAWPEEDSWEGVSTEALFTQIKGVRSKIEPIPSQPCYIINWKGTPEGGYRCFPEGRPQ